MSGKIVFKDGKYRLLPGATREDELRLIELTVAHQSKAANKAVAEAKGEPAKAARKEVNVAKKVEKATKNKTKEVIKGETEADYLKYAEVVPKECRSAKQCIQQVVKAGAMALINKPGHGLCMVVVPGHRYNKTDAERPGTYWTNVGKRVTVRTRAELEKLLTNGYIIEIRSGTPKLLPKQYITREGKKEIKRTIGFWIESRITKGHQPQIAYRKVSK